MSSIVSFLGYTEVVICLAALCFLVVKKQWRDYWALGSFLAVRLVASASLSLLTHYFFHRLDRRAVSTMPTSMSTGLHMRLSRCSRCSSSTASSGFRCSR